MFDTSSINHSQMSSGTPNINYDSSALKKGGYRCRYALNPKNPEYKKIINELNNQKISYKIIPIENKQKHIWIKEK
jgi:prephenate dehydratase